MISHHRRQDWCSPEPISYVPAITISESRCHAVRIHGPVTRNDIAATTGLTGASIANITKRLGQRYRSFFYILVTAALGGGLVIDGHYFRGADGRSGEIGWLRAANESGVDTELQRIVSLSALYARLANQGFRVRSPSELMQLGPEAGGVVDGRIRESSVALIDSILAVNCLINPSLRMFEAQVPAIAPVARATTADDAPAVGAAILAFSDRLLPTRLALLKA